MATKVELSLGVPPSGGPGMFKLLSRVNAELQALKNSARGKRGGRGRSDLRMEQRPAAPGGLPCPEQEALAHQ
jgi:hypothetical protein